jgi:hypothetical protein
MNKHILVLWLVSIFPIFSTNYYVDNNATGNNDGTSWQNAWTLFANIDWTSIQPGDTVYISDGTYNERIEILSSGGTSGNPIVISNSTDEDHDGEVILVSDGSESSGVKILSNSSNREYITVQGLTIQDFKYGIYINGESNTTHDISIKNCRLIDFKRAGVFATGFGNLGNLYNILVDGCFIDTPDNDTTQTDCIYMQSINDITISNNYILVDNIDEGGHNDLIQVNVGNNGAIFNNIGIHDDDKDRNCQGFFFESVTGAYRVYNNAIHLSNNGKALDGKIKFKTSSAHTIIVNNTIYGYSGALIKTSDSSAVIKNNILYSEGRDPDGSEFMLEFDNGRGPDAEVDYNCYYDPTGTMTNINLGSIGPNSIEANPNLSDISIQTMDFDLSMGSACIDAGTDMSSLFSFDINNLLRPIGDDWDIGAYEFNNAVPVELFSFSAIIYRENVILKWRTATEVNNYGFDVEHKNIDEEWNSLGFVKGNGNSNSPKEYEFIDKKISNAGKYYYRLKQIDNSGSYRYSKAIFVDFDAPAKYDLKQNYPNPFNPETAISFTLPDNEYISLKIFNTLGEEVQTLFEGNLNAGTHTYFFNRKELASGLYIYSLFTDNVTLTRKMLLMK